MWCCTTVRYSNSGEGARRLTDGFGQSQLGPVVGALQPAQVRDDAVAQGAREDGRPQPGGMAQVDQRGADPRLGGVVTPDGGVDQIREAVGVGLADRVPSRRG